MDLYENTTLTFAAQQVVEGADASWKWTAEDCTAACGVIETECQAQSLVDTGAQTSVLVFGGTVTTTYADGSVIELEIPIGGTDVI